MPRLECAATLAILAAAGTAVFAPPASAQAHADTPASSPVQIVARRVADTAPARKDVTRVCPALHAELPEALASAHRQIGFIGTVRLRFTLDGDQVVEARASEGPRAYHRFVRTAIRGATCVSDRAGPQVFELTVRFADPDERTGDRVALRAD